MCARWLGQKGPRGVPLKNEASVDEIEAAKASRFNKKQ